MKIRHVWFVLLSTALPAAAQDASIGEREYMNSCAQCHGAAADGKGPLADLLTVAAPALTGLQKANGGVFPVSRLYETIEGDAGVAAHGTRDMPAWGMRYSQQAETLLLSTASDDTKVARTPKVVVSSSTPS